MIPIKNAKEIEKMRQACRTASDILDRVSDLIRPGITTKEADEAAADFMSEARVKSECPSVGWGVRIMISKRVLGAGAAVAMMFGVADAQAQWFVTPTGPGVLYFGVEGGWTHLTSPTDSVGGFKFTENFDASF